MALVNAFGAIALDATSVSIRDRLPATIGQKAMAASLAVVIASDQSAVPVSGTVTVSQPVQVVGSVAAAATDSGNPIKIGAVYNSTKPTYTNGQRVDLQSDTRGKLYVTLGTPDADRAAYVNVLADTSVNTNTVLWTGAFGMAWNGTSWDRIRLEGALGGQTVGGSVAAAATDSGNPVKVGGVYNSTPPTYSTGQRGDLQIGTRGSLSVQVMATDSVTSIAGAASADTVPVSTQALAARGFMYVVGAAGVWNRVRDLGAAATGLTLGVLAAGGLSYNGSSYDAIKNDGVVGGQAVGGTVAAAATDSGNPVKVGAKYNLTQPTYSDGQRGDLQIDSRGNTRVAVFGADGIAGANVTTPADGVTTGLNSISVRSINMHYNGTGWDRQPGNTSGQFVIGNVASGATDASNPVKVGGKYNATRPTLTDGQRGDMQLGTRGSLGVTLFAADSVSDIRAATPTSDAESTSRISLWTVAQQFGFNEKGTPTWDRWRNNLEPTVLASAARTATTNSSDQTNYNNRGVHVMVNVTATTTGIITPKIQGKDPVSSTYYDILIGTAINTTGITVLKVYPGITASANASACDILPRTWRVVVTHTDATSITYSVGASVIL